MEKPLPTLNRRQMKASKKEGLTDHLKSQERLILIQNIRSLSLNWKFHHPMMMKLV